MAFFYVLFRLFNRDVIQPFFVRFSVVNGCPGLPEQISGSLPEDLPFDDLGISLAFEKTAF